MMTNNSNIAILKTSFPHKMLLIINRSFYQQMHSPIVIGNTCDDDVRSIVFVILFAKNEIEIYSISQ